MNAATIDASRVGVIRSRSIYKKYIRQHFSVNRVFSYSKSNDGIYGLRLIYCAAAYEKNIVSLFIQGACARLRISR